jgi:DnaJ family protein C protein 7
LEQQQLNIIVGNSFCRFDAAVAAAENARRIDPGNAEVGMILNNVRLVARARAQGNELFKAAKFSHASIAYGEGLKYDPSNPVLHCNRAACWWKLDRWEKAVDDCNEALRIQPNYTKALLRRAVSYSKVSNSNRACILILLAFHSVRCIVLVNFF